MTFNPNEVPCYTGSMSAEYVTAFNNLMRKFMTHADLKYGYPSDVVYDAATIIAEWQNMHDGSTSGLRWYVRPMGTYLRGQGECVDSTIPTCAMYLIEVIRMDYGSFAMNMREVYGPFVMASPYRGEV
jgi:hypothetical protein